MPETHLTTDSTERQSEARLAALLEAVRQHDRRAFEALYDTTVQRIYSLALRITRQHEIAEEVVSDVYLQVWRQAERFDGARGNVAAWLTVLCRSRALDAMRRLKPCAEHETPGSERAADGEEPQHPQDLLLAVERHSAVHAALSKLDDQQRQLLALAYFRGYSHSELAQFTGLPIGTVKSQLRRTLMILKTIMSGVDGTLGEVT